MCTKLLKISKKNALFVWNCLDFISKDRKSFYKAKKQLSIGFKQLRGLQSDRKGDTLKKKGNAQYSFACALIAAKLKRYEYLQILHTGELECKYSVFKHHCNYWFFNQFLPKFNRTKSDHGLHFSRHHHQHGSQVLRRQSHQSLTIWSVQNRMVLVCFARVSAHQPIRGTRVKSSRWVPFWRCRSRFNKLAYAKTKCTSQISKVTNCSESHLEFDYLDIGEQR